MQNQLATATAPYGVCETPGVAAQDNFRPARWLP